MQRIKTVSLVVGLLLTACVCLPSASLARATPCTMHLPETTKTLTVSNPCFGTMRGTLTYKGVVHVTETKNTYHKIVQIHGTSVVESPDSSFPTFSGRFSEVSRTQVNRAGSRESFVVTQTGPNMKFHITFQLTIGPTGDVKVWASNIVCEK
jgi:hypothetical protein